MEGCSADQAARRWLENNEAMVAVSAAQAGAALSLYLRWHVWG